MKPFRTIIKPDKPAFSISHQHKLVSIGSCFSENIGKKFTDYKFTININPFGQQYNPHSIANALSRLLEPVPYTEKDLTEHDGLYHSFDHHGSFSGSDKEETLRFINEKLKITAADLQNADVLFLTFGTAHVFSLKQGKRVVSNCHKFPGTMFNQTLMLPDEIVAVLEKPLSRLQQLNSKIKIVLTVSPVRYFAFGHYENSVSKAHLFAAIYALQQKNPGLYYFPAYELVMDDLRDYRFYTEDMVHPNKEATNYVWDAICSTILDKNTNQLLKDIEEIRQAAGHRPRNPGTEAHLKFIQASLLKIERLKKEFALDFSEEENLLGPTLPKPGQL